MADNDSWVEKYRPENWGDIQGNNSSLKDIKDWARDWSPGDKPQLLHGEAGTGKTSTVYVVENKMNWSLNQINASSARTTEDIESLASAVRSKPIGESERQLLLLDEVDSLSSSSNLNPLLDALSSPPSPIMLTANKKWEIPNSITRKCKLHKFKLGKRSRRAKIRDIIDEEGLDISTQDLARLVERPDLRSAINDLQRYAEGDDVEWGSREMESSDFDAIDNLLQGESYSGSDSTPDKFIYWIDENFRSDMSNLGKNLRGIEMAVIYDALSRSDTHLGKVGSENYRYWKFAGALQDMVGEARLTETYGNWTDKSFPSWFRSRQEKIGSGSKTEKVYRNLSDYDKGRFEISGNYVYFKEVLLPLLKELPREDRLNIAKGARLDPEWVEVLDLDSKAYKDWKITGDIDSREEKSEGSQAIDW